MSTRKALLASFVTFSFCIFPWEESALAKSSNIEYHGVSIDSANTIHVKSASTIRSRTPDNHSRIWDIYDHDRKIDQVMSLNNQFMEWHDYKRVGKALCGDVVAHQRYSSKFPTRYPWIDFEIARLQPDGEMPAIVPAKLLANQKLECTYILYVFRTGDIVQVAYDANGVMGRCGLMGQDGIDTVFFGAKESKENFSKYGIPDVVKPDAKSVVINSVMQSGLDKVDFLPLPTKSQLDHVFLIRQYDSARLFDVTTFDLQGQRVSNQVCKFSSRPLDDKLAKIFKTGPAAR